LREVYADKASLALLAGRLINERGDSESSECALYEGGTFGQMFRALAQHTAASSGFD